VIDDKDALISDQYHFLNTMYIDENDDMSAG